jgi:ribonuclease HI
MLQDKTALLDKSNIYSGIVAYTDGSCRAFNPGQPPVPGAIGWGMHCFVYNDEKPKKGTGHPKIAATIEGYVPKSEKDGKEVTVLQYATVAGSRKEIGSNNTAEILGINAALEYAKQYRIKDLLIKSDSKVAIGGLLNKCPEWVKNDWKFPDGNLVSNYQEWQRTLKNYNDVINNGTKVEIKWIKGHSTFFGNNLVDKVAGIASHKSKEGIQEEITKENHPDGYWKPKEERHPFIAYRGMFFNTVNNRCKPGEYYLCNMVKSDEFIGQRDTDGAFGYIQLCEPDPVLELVRDRQNEVTTDISTLVLARIDRIYKDTRADDLMQHGKYALVRGHHQHAHLYFVDALKDKKEPVTEELTPPMLAFRVITAFSVLIQILEAFKAIEVISKDSLGSGVEIIEITDRFFETCTVTKGKTTQVVSQFKDIASSDKEVKETMTLFNQELVVRQVFGIHIPPRNAIKKLEGVDKDNRVWLIVVQESPTIMRYHTVIKSDKDWSIWSGYYSNMIVSKT